MQRDGFPPPDNPMITCSQWLMPIAVSRASFRKIELLQGQLGKKDLNVALQFIVDVGPLVLNLHHYSFSLER